MSMCDWWRTPSEMSGGHSDDVLSAAGRQGRQVDLEDDGDGDDLRPRPEDDRVTDERESTSGVSVRGRSSPVYNS